MVDDAQRIRVIRAILGMSSADFAARVGVTPGVITHWEKGRYGPQRKSRIALAEICQKERIAFLPSGMPVPVEDVMATQEKMNGESNPSTPDGR